MEENLVSSPRLKGNGLINMSLESSSIVSLISPKIDPSKSIFKFKSTT